MTPKNKKSTFIIYITEAGRALAARLKADVHPEAEAVKYDKKIVRMLWPDAQAIFFIGAAGIAVRAIAPLIKNKTEDPAVIVMDELGRNVISLLSGHAGGANRLVREAADFFGGNAVITTATDINGLTPVDIFAAGHDLLIEPRESLPRISARHLRYKKLLIYSEYDMGLPPDYEAAAKPEEADVLITDRVFIFKTRKRPVLYLRPRDIALGIGFNSGTDAAKMEEAVEQVFKKAGLSASSIGVVGTHVKKAADPELIEFARRRGIGIRGFQGEELNAAPASSPPSDAAKRALGVRGVSEPAALLAGFSSGEFLLIKKTKAGRDITIAAARIGKKKDGAKSKKLAVVGSGPGGLEHLTPQALDAIRESDYIVGYKSYLELITPLIKGKKKISSSMTEEVSRTREAVRLASGGNSVCLISGGDPGVYGMAGLAIEVASGMDPELEVVVIPGITALNACASRLGAPLMHDFAVISLSDRLTPWRTIEERLRAAAKADFVTVLYNPKSSGRKTQIERAREIFLLAHRDGDTPVGVVTDATRQGEKVVITTLRDMLNHEINMKSTVIIGNSMSRRLLNQIVTPRGYERKFDF